MYHDRMTFFYEQANFFQVRGWWGGVEKDDGNFDSVENKIRKNTQISTRKKLK